MININRTLYIIYTSNTNRSDMYEETDDKLRTAFLNDKVIEVFCVTRKHI